MLSSTFTDLKEHRGRAIQAISKLGYMPRVMEHSGAQGEVDVIDTSLAMVRDAAAYIGVISLKYGQTPFDAKRNPNRLSVTELEFNEAMHLGRPIVLFMMGDDHLVKKADIESDPDKLKKLNEFRERAKQTYENGEVHRVYEVFESLEQFSFAAAIAVGNLVRHLERMDKGLVLPRTISNIPINIPFHFIGRDGSLAVIDQAFRAHDRRAAIVALHGLRGVGKTTLAAAYAELHRADYRAVWWIRAETEPTMRADLVGLGLQLGWVEEDAPEEQALTTVMDRLRSDGEGVLLIYDNAIAPKELAKFLPRGAGLRIILTSNAPNWGGVAASLEIEVWPKTVGADFLMARSGRAAERNAALTLSETLDGLPLAHEQAAAYCERVGVPLAEYKRRFTAAPESFLDDRQDASPEYHNGWTVAKTFAVAIDEAARRHPAAKSLMVYVASLPSEPIPLYLFSEGREKFSAPFSSLIGQGGLDEAVATLRAFALIDRELIPDERDASIVTDCIHLHRLVREVAAAGRDLERSQVRQELLQGVSATYPTDILRDPDTWARARRLDAIAMDLANDDSILGESAKSAQIYVLRQLAKYRLKVLTDYAGARSLLDRALAISKSLGSGHPSAAAILNTLASLFEAQGNLRDACRFCEQALAIREKVLGREDPETAETLNDLGYLLQELGEIRKARSLLNRALAIREKIDASHPDTAMSLNNLGLLMQRQRKFKEAQRYHERALEIREKSLKPEHPDIAVSLNNLGSVLDSLKDLAGARRCYERALAMHQKAFGLEHPDTAMTVNNIGHLLYMDGDFVGARRYYDRALEAGEKSQRLEHPNTATSLFNIGVLLDAQCNYVEARPYFERALAIYEKLDPGSLDTAETLYSLGSLLDAQGKSTDARLHYQRSLGIYEKVNGVKDSETVLVAKEFAVLLDKLELPIEAAAIRRKFGIRHRR